MGFNHVRRVHDGPETRAVFGSLRLAVATSLLADNLEERTPASRS